MTDSHGLALLQLARTGTAADLGAAIRNAVSARAREDQHLDFKREYAADTAGNAEIRKDVAALANAEGGVIVVGVDTEKDPVSGADCADRYATQPPPAGFGDRVEQAIGELVPFLRPLPRVVPLASPAVVVIAVPRAERLVPCVNRRGAPTYFLRFGGHTMPMSTELLADLQLGRRQTPVIALDARAELQHNGRFTRIRIFAQVTVQGLSWVPAMQLGLVGYGRYGDTNQGGTLVQKANASVLEGFVDLGGPTDGVTELLLARLAQPLTNVAPLAGEERMFFIELPFSQQPRARVWRGALFVVPSTGLGQWLQLHVEFDGGAEPYMVRPPVSLPTTAPDAWFGTSEAWAARAQTPS